MSKKLSEMTENELYDILFDLLGKHKLSKSEAELFYNVDTELSKREKQKKEQNNENKHS